jgi:hypothetical protein
VATIAEDYVSFETAKLLKEKGFDESCYQKYDDEGYLSFNHVGYINSDKPRDDFYALAPTLQMAMKWLRDVYNINIDIVSIWNQKRFEYQVFVVTPENAKHCYVDDKLYLGYEEACEEAIKYCLKNLI